jgi:YHS domain-containing protein
MTTRHRPYTTMLLAGLLLAAPGLCAQDRGADGPGAPAAPAAPAAQAAQAAPAVPAAGSDAEQIAAQRPTYPLEVCIISGEPLGAMGARKDVLREGHMVSFCCNDCVKEFDKTPAKYIKQLDEAVVAAQLPTYPLKTCPISGEPLEKPKYAVVGTRLIAVCCNSCKKDVAADGRAALAKVDAAIIEIEARSYPLETCVVDGKPLGDKPVRNLHGLTLVEFCSAECAAHFRAEPSGFLKQLEAARAEHGPGHDEAPKPGKTDKTGKTDKSDKSDKSDKNGDKGNP